MNNTLKYLTIIQIANQHNGPTGTDHHQKDGGNHKNSYQGIFFDRGSNFAIFISAKQQSIGSYFEHLTQPNACINIRRGLSRFP